MQSKVERLDLKTLCPQRKSFNALGTTRSTLFAAMLLGEKFDCIVTAKLRGKCALEHREPGLGQFEGRVRPTLSALPSGKGQGS